MDYRYVHSNEYTIDSPLIDKVKEDQNDKLDDASYRLSRLYSILCAIVVVVLFVGLLAVIFYTAARFYVNG